MKTPLVTGRATLLLCAILLLSAASRRGNGQVPTNGLAAYYPLISDADDASGNGYNGAIEGTNFYFGPGRFLEQSNLYLNTEPGSNSFVAIAPQVGTTILDFNGDFSLSAWISIPDGLGEYQVHNIVSDGSDQTSANLRIISNVNTNEDSNGNDYLQLVGGQSNPGGAADLHAFIPQIRNQWSQVVAVRSGTNASLYQNGSLVATGAWATPMTNNSLIWLGGMYYATNAEYWLVGGLADVRLYSRALSSNEIQQLYAYEAGAMISVTGSPAVGGTVSGGGTFAIGSQTQISATANSGWMFTGWNDGVTNNPRTVIVPAQGASFTADFAFVGFNARYVGLFFDTNGVIPQSSGEFSATLTSSGSFSATISTAGKTYRFSGEFSADGITSNTITRVGSQPLTVQLDFDSPDGSLLNGQVTSGTWTAEIAAERTSYSKTNPAPQAGKYTMLFPGDTNPAIAPGGVGYGAIAVSSLGVATVSGSLGDGTAFSQSATISDQGHWPLYESLYSRGGAIVGWLAFSNALTTDVSGLVSWFKPSQPASKLYPAGFTNQTQAVGSRYDFTNGQPILNFTNGEAQLTGGNLASAITNSLAVANNGKITGTNHLALSINTASGLFKGSFVNPSTKKTVSQTGAVLEKQNIAAGHFLGTNQSGEVFIGPTP